jgi:putative copper resistance protein D
MLVDGVSVTLRALSFIAMFQAAGIAIFLALFGRHLTHSAAAIRRYGVFSAVAALILVLAHYALEAGRMSGDFTGVTDPGLQALVMQSSSSTACAMRVIALVLIAIGLRTRRGSVPVFCVALSVIGALLTAASFTFTGHTTMQPARWLLCGVLFLHLLIVTFWFGALIPLVTLCARESRQIAGGVVTAFSKLAMWVVPALFVAGFLMSVILVRSLAVLSTPYGRLLLAKGAGFALLMIPAAINKWFLGDAIAAGKPRAVASFRQSVAVEYVLIAGVLAITAVMTTFFSPDET